MRALRFILILAPCLAFFTPALTSVPCRALPLFSREYAQPCALCHNAFPRLNAFGSRFRQNGYRMQGRPGAAPWAEHEFPLSLIANLGYALVRTDTADVATGTRGHRSESEVRHTAVDIQSAGTLAENVSFHFQDSLATDTGVMKSGTAFVQFDDLMKHGVLNLRAGDFSVEFPYLADSRRTTLERYLAPVSIPARGFEINGARALWTYGAGLINSRRIEANAKPGTRTFNQFEDTYFWIMRDLGRQVVGARMLFDRQDSNLPIHIWLQHLQVHGSALLDFGRLEVIPAYTFDRFDDRPAAGIHDKHQLALIEALALLDREGHWVLTARLEHEYRTGTDLTPEEDHDLEALGLARYISPNAGVSLECAHAGDNRAGPKLDRLDAYIHVGY